MKTITREINTKSACRRDNEQGRKRMDCGGALAVGLVRRRYRKPCGQSCRGGGP